MHRIDGDGNAGGNFVDGNPALGQRATVVTPQWLNAVQDELVNVLQAAGLVLNKADNSQLIQALGIIILQQLDLRGVWRSTNDGAGSGMDTDLFHGLPPGYFTDIVARLGYTPLNQASYTAADVLAKMLTVDGAGSGLDAALLGGYLPSHYLDQISALSATVSGLFSAANNANGHVMRIGPWKIQLGIAMTVSADTPRTVNFPEAFASAPFWYDAGTRRSGFTAATEGQGEVVGTPNVNSMVVANNNITGDPVIDIPWIAIAYA